MIDKKFDPKSKHRLNNPQRLRNIPIEIIIDNLALNNPKNLVDYGAGTGFMTDFIAESYPDARIFALDIEPQMTEDIENNSGANNIFPILIEDNQMPFSENDIDAAWSITVYHEMQNPEIWLRNVHRTLKTNGKLLIIDWAQNQNPEIKAGPPIEHRINENDIIKSLKKLKFKNIKTLTGLKNHFGIIAQK
ncbi:MAG: class I SAM-dependent methyltransferase [Bacteroidales bacterium]|nr:class I SAM-dependent methyltransferase [Bacteroidales bacterium]